MGYPEREEAVFLALNRMDKTPQPKEVIWYENRSRKIP